MSRYVAQSLLTTARKTLTMCSGQHPFSRLRLGLGPERRAHIVRPRRPAHARLRWRLLQQSEVHVRLSGHSVSVAAFSLPIRAIEIALPHARIESASAPCATQWRQFDNVPSRTWVPCPMLRLLLALLLLRSSASRRDAASILRQNVDATALRHVLRPSAHFKRNDVSSRLSACVSCHRSYRIQTKNAPRAALHCLRRSSSSAGSAGKGNTV